MDTTETVVEWTADPSWAPRVHRAADLVTDDEPTWSAYARGVVFEGWGGMCERVRSHGGETAELLDRYDVLCRPYRDHPLPGNDLVHRDLNVSNLLVADGRIAGIIDVEAANGGSRAYDLVSLATSAARDGAPDGVDELFVEAALRAAGRATVAVCGASSYAGMAAFVQERSPESLGLVQQGARRLLELLDG